MPDNTVYVGRPTKWGNQFGFKSEDERIEAVRKYRDHILFLMKCANPLDLSELRGKDLACWCPIDKPCHADVLIELANSNVNSKSFSREYLEANLDNPGDPYGLADRGDAVIEYLAPCFAVYRHEHARRYRLSKAQGETP